MCKEVSRHQYVIKFKMSEFYPKGGGGGRPNWEFFPIFSIDLFQRLPLGNLTRMNVMSFESCCKTWQLKLASLLFTCYK